MTDTTNSVSPVTINGIEFREDQVKAIVSASLKAADDAGHCSAAEELMKQIGLPIPDPTRTIEVHMQARPVKYRLVLPEGYDTNRAHHSQPDSKYTLADDYYGHPLASMFEPNGQLTELAKERGFSLEPMEQEEVRVNSRLTRRESYDSPSFQLIDRGLRRNYDF